MRTITAPAPLTGNVIISALERELMSAQEDVYRARRAFASFSEAERQQEHGTSGLTRQQVMDDYELTESQIRDALAWARTLV